MVSVRMSAYSSVSDPELARSRLKLGWMALVTVLVFVIWMYLIQLHGFVDPLWEATVLG